jgi:hypothetical protein
MANKKIWLGILVMVLVFGMTVVGCDNDPGNSGPKWVTATGEFAVPLTGTFNSTTLALTDWWGDPMTFSKNGGGLDGVWEGTGDSIGLKLTISGNNWTLASAPVSGSGGSGDGPPPPPQIDGDYMDVVKGTLTVNGTNVTFIATHVSDEVGKDGEVDKADPGPNPKKNYY